MSLLVKRKIKNDIYPVVVSVYVYDDVSDIVSMASRCGLNCIDSINALSVYQKPYNFSMHYTIHADTAMVHHEVGHTSRDIFRYVGIPICTDTEEPLQYYSDYLYIKCVNTIGDAQEKYEKSGVNFQTDLGREQQEVSTD